MSIHIALEFFRPNNAFKIFFLCHLVLDLMTSVSMTYILILICIKFEAFGYGMRAIGKANGGDELSSIFTNNYYSCDHRVDVPTHTACCVRFQMKNVFCLAFYWQYGTPDGYPSSKIVFLSFYLSIFLINNCKKIVSLTLTPISCVIHAIKERVLLTRNVQKNIWK